MSRRMPTNMSRSMYIYTIFQEFRPMRLWLKWVHSWPTTMEPEHDFQEEPLLSPGHHFQVSCYLFGGVHKQNNQGVIIWHHPKQCTLNGKSQGTIGCTPNSVPMVFIVFSGNFWDYNPYIPNIRAYKGFPIGAHVGIRGTSNYPLKIPETLPYACILWSLQYLGYA